MKETKGEKVDKDKERIAIATTNNLFKISYSLGLTFKIFKTYGMIPAGWGLIR